MALIDKLSKEDVGIANQCILEFSHNQLPEIQNMYNVTELTEALTSDIDAATEQLIQLIAKETGAKLTVDQMRLICQLNPLVMFWINTRGITSAIAEYAAVNAAYQLISASMTNYPDDPDRACYVLDRVIANGIMVAGAPRLFAVTERYKHNE